MSDTTAQPMIHGPGGLLSTPGLGLRRRRKGRKWGMRLKDSGYSARAGQTIRGNLARGGDGKFTAAGNASAAKPKRGAKKPKATPAQRATERNQASTAKRTANRDAVKQAMADQDAGLAPKAFDNLVGLAAGTLPDQIGADGLVKMGMAERGSDGTLRLTASGRAAVNAANRGDAKAAIDAVSRGTDQAKRSTEAAQKRTAAEAKRAAAAAERAAAAAGKKLEPKAPKAGGGGGSKKPEADKRAERAKKADATAGEVGLAPRDVDSLRQAAAGLGGASNPAMVELGLIGSDGLTTDQGRRALTALERGDVRGYQAAVQDAKARQGREAAAAARRQQAESGRTATQQRRLDRLRRRAQSGARLTEAQRDQLTDAGLASESGGMWRVKAETYGGTKRSKLDDNVFAGPDRSFPIVTAQDVRDAVQSLGRTKHDKDAVKRGIIRRARAIGATDALPEDWRAKSFAVFKDHTGRYRWLARTTTAYQDRDKEIIEAAALDADSQRMTEQKQFGPLRYWHVGQPDPFDTDRPWGPGLDIGDCDYSCLIGRTRIESGTFRDPHIAQKVARQAEQYELSPGFFHPIDQPVNGVFSAIRTFERSIVPVKYGRASNLFTGLAVKETRMDIDEMDRRFKAAIADLGLDATQAQALGAELIATEKAAQAQGIAFKSDALNSAVAAGLSAPPAPPEEITIGGVVYTVKAAPPIELDAPPVEAKADGDMIEEIAEELEPEAEMAGDYLGDMTWDEFAAKLADLLAPVLKMQDMVKAVSDMGGELKSMYGGVAQKDDTRAQELAALKSQYTDLATKIAQIEGNQPATILPNEVAAALKSGGPAQPTPPERPEVVAALADPTRPFAGWGMQTYPELYQNGENT
jgi:colicin import membrane protein